jgi:hypothetical protein
MLILLRGQSRIDHRAVFELAGKIDFYRVAHLYLCHTIFLPYGFRVFMCLPRSALRVSSISITSGSTKKGLIAGQKPDRRRPTALLGSER